MKMFNRILLIVILVCSGISIYGQNVDAYASAVRMTSSNGTFNSKFYNVTSNDRGGWSAGDHAIDGTGGSWNNASNLFHDKDFGTHIAQSGTINYKGGEVKTIHNSLTQNVCPPEMRYRINNVTEGTTGSWVDVELPFKVNCSNPSQFGDWLGQCDSTRPSDDWQKWNKNDLNLDLSQRNEGDYQLEVHFRIRGDNSSTDSNSCSAIDYINDANEDGTGGDNYIATFKICPSASFDSSSNPTTCGGNGTIVLNLVGVDDGTYSDRFYYEDADNNTHQFAGVVVSGGIATISAPAGTYNNIRYWVTTGCDPVGDYDVVLTDPALPLAPTGDVTQEFCSVDNPTVADLEATGSNLQWYEDAVGGTPLASNVALETKTYYVSQTTNNCEGPRLSVEVTISDPSAPTTADTTPSFCSITNPTLASITVTGSNIIWYDTATKDNVLASNTALVNGENYYASQTVGGCESDQLLEVTVTISDPSAPTTADTTPSFCSITNPTLASITVTGSNIIWYDTATKDNVLASNTALVNGENYYASQTVGGCESDQLLEVTVTVTTTPNEPQVTVDCSLGFNQAKVTVTSPIGVEYEYSLNGGVFQPSVEFENLSNSTYAITVRRVGTNCSIVGDSFEITCGCVNTPTVSLSTATAETCGIETVSVLNNTFAGSATQVNISHNGQGTLNINTSAVSPFDIVYTPDALDAGNTVVITVQTNNPLGAPCAASTRTVQITVNSKPSAPVVGSIQQPTCAIATGSVELSGLPSSGNWIVTAVPGGATISGNSSTTATFSGLTPDSYRFYVENQFGCDSDQSVIEADIDDQPSIPVVPTAGLPIQPTCSVQTGTITINEIAGVEYSVNGTDYFSDRVFSGLQTGSYTISVRRISDNTCVRTSPDAIVINEVPDLPIVPTAGLPIQPTCSVQTGTITINEIAGVEYSVNGTDYFSDRVFSGLQPGSYTISVRRISDNTCVRTSPDAIVINAVPTQLTNPISGGSQEICLVDYTVPLKATATVQAGEQLIWYNANGDVLTDAEVILSTVGTVTYYAEAYNPITECRSADRTEVVLTISDTNPLIIDDSLKTQTFCNNTSVPTVADLQPSGANIRWYANPTGGDALDNTLALEDDTRYYGVQLGVNGCESSERAEILVNISCEIDLSISYDIISQYENPDRTPRAQPYVSEPIRLEIKVTNLETVTGSTLQTNTSTGVKITIDLPSGYENAVFTTPLGTSYDTTTRVWTIGTLAPGEERTLVINATVGPILPGQDNSIYFSEARVEGNENESYLINNTAQINTITPIPFIGLFTDIEVIAKIPLENEAEEVLKAATPKIGDTVIFRIYVENTGISAATDSKLYNTLPPGYTLVDYQFSDTTPKDKYNPTTGIWEIDFIRGTYGTGINGISPILYLITTVNPNPTDSDYYVDKVRVERNPNEYEIDVDNNTDQAETFPIPQFDLSIEKTIEGNNTTPPVESELIFTLEVKNAGPSHASNVTVTDQLPSGYTHLRHTSGENYDPATGIWNVGNLQVNQSKTLNITVFVNVTGEYKNEASVIVSEENDKFPDNNKDDVTTIPVPVSELEITKTNPFEGTDAQGNPKTVNLHDNVTYTITARNNGPSPTTSVSVTEEFPLGLTYLSSDSENFTVTTDIDGKQKGVWNIKDPIFEGEVRVLTVVAVVNGKEDLPSNFVRVKEDTGILDTNDNNNTDESTVTYAKDCDLRVYNYVSANNDGHNDYFIIENIDCYPDNTVEIYNRWGVQVYKTTGYGTAVSQNIFTGISDGRATVSQDKTLPEGTYFYVIHYKGAPGSGSKSGYLELTR